MGYLIFKAAISGALIAVISEIARRNAGFAALVASLPLVSLMAMIWLWRDTGDLARIADHSAATFWYVLPSLPLFLILPALLRGGLGFWLALLISCATTVALYFALLWIAPKVGIRL